MSALGVEARCCPFAAGPSSALSNHGSSWGRMHLQTNMLVALLAKTQM